ncbi:MAG: hypothetical protein IJ658_13425, partial [Kiritimatiellae bacterium]|nr:hypothetical protein [Kiritimatiellia bacterium]
HDDRARNAVLLEHHNPMAQLQRSDAHEQREISSGGGMNRPTLMHEEPKFRMQYTVKHRNADGLIDYTVVEAASRAAVFPLLEKRGISPISVTEGVHKNARPSGSPKRPTPVRGILAGLCVVALALGA